jgi:hypothetical protein
VADYLVNDMNEMRKLMETIDAISEADGDELGTLDRWPGEAGYESKLKYFENDGSIKDGFAATLSDRSISNGKVSTTVTKIDSLSKGSGTSSYNDGYHVMGDGISGMLIGSLDSITIYKLVKVA